MKKIFPLFLIAALAIFFASCKKDNNNNGGGGDYYVKAKFDGQLKEFSSSPATVVKSKLAEGMYAMIIGGVSTNEQFNIALWSDKDDFQAGKTFALEAPEVSSYNTLAYVSPIGSAAPENMWTSIYQYGVVTETLSVTITEATSSYIKGTFSGIIYQNNESTPNSKQITEGVFSAKF